MRLRRGAFLGGTLAGVRVWPRALVVGVLLVAQAVPSATAGDRSGTLDPSFGTEGRVATSFGWRQAEAEDIVRQPDGKIVAAGHSLTTESAGRFTLARYNKTGALDPTFGGAGRLRSGFGPGSDAGAFALLLQPDGRLVAAGEVAHAQDYDYDFALTRYNPDGTVDRTFGADGKVESDIGGDDHLYALAPQPDGKILGVGVAYMPPAGAYLALARYLADGTLDSTFGLDGVVTADFGSAAFGRDVLLQPDGKIVVVGYVESAGISDGFALARYEANGTLDESFGSGGEVITGLGSYSGATAVVLQPDGNIVAGGSARGSGTGDFVLLRYDASGDLDTTFGSDGQVTTDFVGTNDFIADLALQADGQIVATGGSDTTNSQRFALARYDPDGSLDRSFGNDGKVRTGFGTDICWATSLVLQRNGRIVVGGWIFSHQSFALARYLA